MKMLTRIAQISARANRLFLILWFFFSPLLSSCQGADQPSESVVGRFGLCEPLIDVSFDGNLGIINQCSSSYPTDNYGTYYVVELTTLLEGSYNILDSLYGSFEIVGFCNDSMLFALKYDNPGYDVYVRDIKTHSTELLLDYDIMDSSTYWLDEVSSIGFAVWVGEDTLVAARVIAGISLFRVYGDGHTMELNWIPDCNWPAFSLDGTALYMVCQTEDSTYLVRTADTRTGTYFYDVKTGDNISYSPQGTGLGKDLFWLECFASDNRCSILSRSSVSDPLDSEFSFYSDVRLSFFRLTRRGIVAWLNFGDSSVDTTTVMMIQYIDTDQLRRDNEH